MSVARREAAPPSDDPVYRAVVAARDRQLLSRMVAAAWADAGFAPPAGLHARVIQAHYKPRVRARLLVRVECPAIPPRKRLRLQYLYIQAYPGMAAASRRLSLASKRPLKCLGPPVFLLPEWASVAWALPNGPMLRMARSMLRRRPLARFLVEAGLLQPGERGPRAAELVRYVPRHRAVFRVKKIGAARQRAYVKIYAPGGDEPARRNLETAAEAAAVTGSFLVPALLAHVPRRRALVMEEIRGRRFSAIDPAREPGVHGDVGHALAALHLPSPGVAARWSPETEIAGLRMAMADVACALPSVREELDDLVTRIDARRLASRFPADTLIHGNLFGDQILVGDTGRIGIVDWDDLCLGDPLFDVGRLAADISFRWPGGPGAAALLSGYSAAGGVLDRIRLDWQVATALLLRAKISALRPLPPTWIDDIERCVHLAQSLTGEP